MSEIEFSKIPGEKVNDEDAQDIINKFLLKYRPQNKWLPTNLPTACTLEGQKEWGIIKKLECYNASEVYVLDDRWPVELFQTTPTEIAKFLSNLQPWDEFDICIFDEDMAWCVGLTHNDYLVVVDELGKINV